jgi:putative ABC transport system permease protein
MNNWLLLRHSLRTMSRFKLRTAFMMVGTVVGVAALTLVVSVGQAAERKILSMVRQNFGVNSILILDGGGGRMGGPRSEAFRLKLDDMAALANEVPGIETWDPQQTLSASVRRGESSDTTRVLGESERSQLVWSRGAVEGEYFDAAAVAGSARVAIIGTTVARQLFGSDSPVGSDILIGGVNFRVIGILEPWGNDVHGMDRDNEVVVPITTLMRRVTNVDTIGGAKLLVKDPAAAEEVAREIKQILRSRHAIADGQPDDFTVMTALQAQKMVAMVQRILFVYLPLVAGVALLVSAIIAASLMLVSVNDRVSEIGVRRAIGARAQDIRLQFLIETAATTLAGGIAGLVLGYAGARLAANQMHLGVSISWSAVLLAISVSIITGLLAGVVPARRAARLQPVEALR